MLINHGTNIQFKLRALRATSFGVGITLVWILLCLKLMQAIYLQAVTFKQLWRIKEICINCHIT